MKINKKPRAWLSSPQMTICTDSYSVPFMARMAATFTKQLFPEHLSTTVQDAVCGIASATALLKVEGNMRVMTQVGTANEMFKVVTENRGLWNHFTNTQASPEQSHDLLSFRKTAWPS